MGSTVKNNMKFIFFIIGISLVVIGIVAFSIPDIFPGYFRFIGLLGAGAVGFFAASGVACVSGIKHK